MKELNLILQEEIRKKGITKLTEIDPDSPLADKVHHAKIYKIFENDFTIISQHEGRLFSFSFKISNGDHIFAVLKSTAEELGLSQNIYRGSLWYVFTRVKADLTAYLQKIENKPS